MKKLILTLLLAGTALPAFAAEDTDGEVDEVATFAIQNRQYRLRHEINVEGGVLPVNAFVKGITVGGGYTFHFNDQLAWEIAQFHYSFGVETDLRKQLFENFGVQPTQIEQIQFYGSSGFVWKPFYGKFAAGSRNLVHAELFFVFGNALARFLNPDAARFGFNVGLGARLHLVEHLSMRLDARYMLFITPPAVFNEVHVTLGLAVSFGGGK